MHYYLSTWWRWIRRCGYSRGFGVQSPSAYSFIRYVINEHYPYYAYSDLKDKLDMLSPREHKIGRLLLRLSNFWQPQVRYRNTALFDSYMCAGCIKSVDEEVATLVEQSFPQSQESSSPCKYRKTMVVIDIGGMSIEDVILKILPHCTDQTLMVLLGKLHGKKLFETWKRLQEDERVGITYDLYYVGIVFFDKSIFKQHYLVNF